MDFRTLKQRVDAGEDQYTEFKLKAAHPDKIMREVIAFANANGGLLLVGVDDNRTIPGLPNPDEEVYVLDKALNEMCSPVPEYRMERIQVQTRDRWVLAYHIAENPDKPSVLTLPGTDPPGKAYVRVRDKSIQASREFRELLKMQARNKPMRFEYGEKEKALVQYLGSHKGITLEEFAALCNLPMRQASRTLVLLCYCGLLKLIPHDEGDVFELKDPAMG
ncbi:MAG: ATP-binding protein [Bacteroidota bacterium]